MRELALPLAPVDVPTLTVGEQLLISGVVFTFRRGALNHVREGKPLPFAAQGAFIYHCGPVGKKRGKKWKTWDTAPDLSPPLDEYSSDVLARTGARGLIGRGGVGHQSVTACRRFGACALQTVGGAGLALARRVVAVRDVHLRDELGDTEAIWELELKDFPAVVVVDSEGRSLRDMVRESCTRKIQNLSE